MAPSECVDGRNEYKLPGGRHGAAGHHADEVSAIFGAAVDVAVQAGGADLDPFYRVGREVAGEGLLHVGLAEHLRAGTGHGDAGIVPRLRDEDSDQGEARGRLRELRVRRLFGLREADGSDDLAGFEGGLE